MVDTVFLIRDKFDGEVYIVFDNEEIAEQYVKEQDPNENYMTIQAYVLHNKLT